MAVNKLELASTVDSSQNAEMSDMVSGGIAVGGDAMPAGSFVAMVYEATDDPKDIYNAAVQAYQAFVAVSGGSRP